ncbi:cyclic nucleotide-binding domain protein (macronuclear) [Tetrahymena thermophila SB210]|uniref:Cyclic nucleotide-binding domain protein n=1 Tax=Tetrahymena thermophila (strain SB210) TaxID=312017 RepID=Q24DS1_TETTS|nr:cyclic nucleotide-binding domain protein [Tetrahymena thermophila SB210]EAS05919.2 cyclic nucleotide-binding domain protein [Tetrahymena thermophila SB210]|eukprot:XP_001026164.2 cyclic nucleotide-binding domain protein [Tetrahymena thermophila SB210]
MDISTSSYNNNQTYRCQIPFSEEEHRVIQNFPFKSNDSEVEPEIFSQFSRRQLSTKREFSSQERNQSEFEKSAIIISRQNSRRSFQQDTSQQQINTPVKSLFRAALTKNISQLMDQSIIQSVNNMEEMESKVFPVKLVRVLKLLVNVQHFYRMLTKNARIFNKITQKQHDLVGDVVSVYSKNKKNVEVLDKGKFSKLIFNIFYHLTLLYQLIKIPFFAPSGLLIRIWDTLLAILILFSTFLLNLQLFFTMQIQEFKVLFQTLFILSIIDILMELNTGVLKKGNITYNRQFIIKSYIKSNLIFDILGNMPLFVFVFNIEVTTNLQVMINILFIFKWTKIFKILRWLTFYVSYEKNNKNAFDLFRLLFFVIGICHIFCLFWHGLGLFEINNGYTNSWIANKNLLDADIFERYVYSFYFLAVTMVTVGYGDITPQNSIEVVFTTVTIFVTCIVYAFSLNTIGSIIENIEKKDKKYKENMQVIHGLMREENVSRDLRIKVSNYVEYLYKESNEVLKKQEKLIINKLSQKLRNDLSLEIQGKYLSNIPLFKNIKVKDKISNLMEEHLYSPGEIIFKQGDQDDCSLFYIVKGKVSITFISDSENSQREDLIVSSKGKHEYFGEISFISGNQRTLTAKASDFCRIYKINRDKYIQIIKENDQDFENFQMIKEAISLNNNYKFCSIYCSICQSGNHFSIECPKTHLTLTKQVVISRYNNCTPHTERAQFDRKRQKFNTYSRCILLRQAVAEINQHESLFEILDQIEFDCNLGDIFDLDEVSDGERENTSKIQRIKTQDSQKKGNNSPIQNQINQEETANASNDFPKANRMRVYLQNTGSTNSLSPRSSDLNKYPQQIQQSKKSQMCVSNLDEPKLSASDLKSSDDDETSSNSSSSSDSSNSKSSSSSVSQSDKATLQENSFLKSPESRIQNKAEQKKKKTSIAYSPSKLKQHNNEKGLDQQQSSVFNYQNTHKLSSTNLQSKIQIESADKIEEKNVSEQKILNKNQDKNELIQPSTNNHSLSSFSLISNHINNETNQIQQQTPQINDQKSQSLLQSKTINARLSSKNRISQQPQDRRTIRESRTINQYDLIQQSIQAFMNQQQRHKRQITFQDKENHKKQQQQQQQQQSYQQQNQYSKGLSNQDKRQSSHKNHLASIFYPPQLLDENIQKLEQKLQEFTDPPDLVNYQMLQTFDKAKIYKYYLPNYNYPEIVLKWVQYQKKLQLKHNLSRRSYQKKKQPRVQTKRKITQQIHSTIVLNQNVQ